MTDEGWKLEAEHQATGRRIYSQADSFVHTGNNEGTLSRKFEVRDKDDRVLMTSWFETEWEYYGAVRGRFEANGTVLVLSGTDGTSERAAIPYAE